MRRWLCATVAVGVLALASPALGRQPAGFQLETKIEERLRVFLMKRYCEGALADTNAKYSAARLPLGPDGKSLILVYINSAGWCGSGGCDLSLYDDIEKSFREAADIVPVSKPPIGMLTARTNGWRDLVVGVQEGADGVFPARVRYVQGQYAINQEEYGAAKRSSALKNSTTIFTGYGDKPLCQAQTS